MRPYLCRWHRDNRRTRSRSCRPRLEGMESRALLSAVSWTGGAGDNNWDTPANWSTDSVPGSADDVTIDTTANVVHSQSVTDTINSLTSSEPLTISGGTLSIASASTISSPLSITGGTLTGTGAITVSGLLTPASGTISGSGAVDANGGILLNRPPLSTVFTLDGRTLTNPAGQTATWTGTSTDVFLSDGAVFDNMGNFLAQSQGGEFAQETGAPSSFNNSGSFTNSGESSFGSGVAFNVAGGTVDVQSGSLSLQGGTDTGATFTSETGATLSFGGIETLDSSSRIGGAGTVDFSTSQSPGTISMAGTYDVTGTTMDDNGRVNFTGTVSSIGATLTSNFGTLNFNTPFTGTAGTISAVQINGGTVNLGTNALDATTLDMTGGTLTGTGAITVSGLLTLGGGTISGSGAVDANGGILLNPPGLSSVVTLDGRTLTNPAGQTATWTGGESQVTMSDGAVFDNLGTFLAQSHCTFTEEVASCGPAHEALDEPADFWPQALYRR
jgi:hypothetical protein